MGFFDSWKCGVRVHLRHNVYYPGNVVEGFVELNVTSPITMVAVRVKATGKEKVVVRRERQDGFYDDGTPIMVTETLFESNCVYKQLITLCGQMKCMGIRAETMVPPGRYTYPFAFQLPMAIPPSFSKRAGDDIADVVYHIKAYVDIPFGRDALDRQWFTVVKPMPKSQWIHRAPATVQRNWQVTFCCCIDKGTVQGHLFMDRTMISIDRDNLVVIADIDNTNGKEPVQSLEIKLMHKLVYKVSWVTETNVLCEGQSFINQCVPAGEKGRIAGTIPLPRNLIPTLVLFNVVSEYWIDLELNIPWASDPKHMFPVILAQSVDESDFSPPVTFGANPFTIIPKGQCPEFYYAPPPNPCFQLNPIPVQPPPGVTMWNCQISPHMPLPGAGWGVPANLTMQRPAGGMAADAIAWDSGVVQAECAVATVEAVDLALGTAAFGTELAIAGASPMGGANVEVTLTADADAPLLS